MLEDLLPDVIEVVEHIAYSHNYRSENTQKRVGELLASIRTRLIDAAAAVKAAEAAAPSPVTDPTPAVTSAPSVTASPVSAPADASGEASVPVADVSAGTPSETPVISQPAAPEATGAA